MPAGMGTPEVLRAVHSMGPSFTWPWASVLSMGAVTRPVVPMTESMLVGVSLGVMNFLVRGHSTYPILQSTSEEQGWTREPIGAPQKWRMLSPSFKTNFKQIYLVPGLSCGTCDLVP